METFVAIILVLIMIIYDSNFIEHFKKRETFVVSKPNISNIQNLLPKENPLLINTTPIWIFVPNNDLNNITDIERLCISTVHKHMSKYNIKIMFGCASFPGIEVDKHKSALAYLHKKYLAPSNIRPVAVKSRYIKMKNEGLINNSNFKKFLTSIPPLIKGYIRLGAFVGDGAVIDYEFNTIDVCIVLPTKKVAARYMDHFDRK